MNPASNNFCCPLVAFANSLDTDQDRQNVKSVSPDLDLNCDTLIVLLKEFFEKVYFEKSQQMTTKA